MVKQTSSVSVKGLEGISSAHELLENLKADPSLLSEITRSAGSQGKGKKRKIGDQLLSLIDGFSALKESMEAAETDDSSCEHEVTPTPSPSKRSRRTNREVVQEEEVFMEDEEMDDDDDNESAQIVIIGASASGLGVASAILTALDLPTSDVRILEATSAVGDSFRAWPPATRFISPSFYSNPFNQMDLNSIGAVGDNGVQAYLKANGKDVLDAQHPTGKEYADYLDHFASSPLPERESGAKTLKEYITFNTKVTDIESLGQENSKGAFKISLSSSAPYPTLYARYIIYAGGEFSHPYTPKFAQDNKAAVHYSKVTDWGEGAKGDWVVVGGGEAGIDAACSLYDNIESGNITIIDKEGGGDSEDPKIVEDPSISLTPRTIARLKLIQRSKHFPEKSIKVIKDHSCVAVGKKGKGFTATICKSGGKTKTTLKADHQIIMATGFQLGASKNCILNGLVEYDDTGRPVLDPECDMSTKTEGLFVCGPMVKHNSAACGVKEGEEEKEEEKPKKKGKKGKKKGKKLITMEEEKKEEKQDVIFCFVYKYRCRFALVAGEILSRLIETYHMDEEGNLDEGGEQAVSEVTTMMDLYKERGMLITDLSGAVCGEVGACGDSC